MDLPTSFGYWVRRRRKALDLTQVDLAQRVGCAKVTIQKIEADERRPSAQIAELLAEHLHIPPAERSTFLQRARGELAVDQLPESAPDGGHIPNPPAMVATDAPAVRPPTAAPTRRSHLPTQPTPLVGRVRELADLARLLDEPHIRLISITGPGGMGKTRLAIALAERLFTTERYLDGVYFVALAPLNAPEQIVPALAEALDFPLDAGKQRVRSPRQQVLDYLREKRLLLVLDNVEHLLGNADAGAGAADLIAALLAAAPRVAIVATSRERLQLREEHRYPLGGLDMPGTEAPSSYSAVALFVQRARSLRPDFVPEEDDLSVVAQICRLVDGMPLAIELAAGWVDTLGLPDIAAEIAHSLDLLATELRDVPARQRSMRAVFDASWRRLGAGDQPVFARQAVFRGGGTRRAVQAVTRATLLQLHTLVGASLLQYDAERDRYTVHELLRQYAAEQLAADPQEEVATCARHAAYYCAFLAERTQALKGAGQEQALQEIEIEAANLHGALAWAGAHGAVALVDQALEGLGHFYQWRGRYQEGLATFAAAAEALADADAPSTRRVQAHALVWKAAFARLLGQLPQADDDLRCALAMLDDPAMATLDTRAERAFALLQLGDLGTEGRVTVEELQRRYAASLALYMELERPWEQSCALLRLGVNARWRGDYDLARGQLRTCRAIREAAGDRRGLAEALNHESQAAVESGATDEALDLARRSQAIYEELGDPAGRAFGLGRLGVIQFWAGQCREAQRTLVASRALYDDLGDQLMAATDDNRLALATSAVGDLDAAWALAAKSIDRFRMVLGSDDPQALWIGGTIALMRGDLSEAVRLLQASAELSEQLGLLWQARWAHSLLATAHWLLGGQAEARADLLAVLRAATALHDVLSLLHALLGLALIFAEQGAPERGLELYALARQHPLIANNQAFTTFFGQRLDAASTALPPEAAQPAQKRGRARDLWATARELLAELEAAGWGVGVAQA